MRERLAQGLLCAVVLTLAHDVRADTVLFGPHDVATVFFVTKSSDRNRVDYGVHLNERCAPIDDGAVFLYWRDLEHTPPAIHGLGIFDYIAYGFSEQRLVHRTRTGGEQLMRLKQLDRPIALTATKDAEGRCTAVAHMRIANVEGAVLTSIYAKLGRIVSVDYIDIHGKHPQTGADLVERVNR